MKIVVLAEDAAWEEVQTVFAETDLSRTNDEDVFFNTAGASIYINLNNNAAAKDYSGIAKQVIINSVDTTLQEMHAAPNILRINGWHTFLKREIWEVAGEQDEIAASFFQLIKKKIVIVPDEPGLVSARIIAMIINEAYFALGDGISTKEEIDTAMKLGTNYPYGPFEWAGKIGLQNIYTLLQKMSITGKRYQPAPALIHELTDNNQ